MKIVINQCYGGFGLSEAAYKELGIPWDGYGYEMSDRRDDPRLVAVIEKLGASANGMCAELCVIEISEGVDWELTEYDGIESVHEKHRSWP